MALETEKYQRKPIYVDVVRVTRQNFEEVAKWCGGTISSQGDNGVDYIKVDVTKPINERQTQAFIGDYVLKLNRGYKVYNHKAFTSAFDKVEVASDEEIGQLTDHFKKETPKPRPPMKKHDSNGYVVPTDKHGDPVEIPAYEDLDLGPKSLDPEDHANDLSAVNI